MTATLIRLRGTRIAHRVSAAGLGWVRLVCDPLLDSGDVREVERGDVRSTACPECERRHAAGVVAAQAAPTRPPLRLILGGAGAAVRAWRGRAPVGVETMAVTTGDDDGEGAA